MVVPERALTEVAVGGEVGVAELAGGAGRADCAAVDGGGAGLAGGRARVVVGGVAGAGV
jgi:hypothetical protein